MSNLPLNPSLPKTHYPKRAVKTQKDRERIHKDSKRTNMKNLPFTFSKPQRAKSKPDIYICENCGREANINKRHCVLIACPCGHINYLDRKEEEE